MRRALPIGLLGWFLVVGGGAWYVAADHDIARVVRLGGMPIALGCLALGAGLMLVGAIDGLRHRQTTRARGDDDDRATGSSKVIRTTIVVRQHHRRHRPVAAPNLIAAPAWPPPQPIDGPGGGLDGVRADRASIPIGETATGDVWPKWLPPARKASAPNPWPPPPDLRSSFTVSPPVH